MADPLMGLTAVSGPSPYAAGCNGAPQRGAVAMGSAVEPFLAADPSDPGHLIGVWQQDRWNNGGANGLLTGSSVDNGRTWTRTEARFTHCSGGNAANGGDYERASDPWIA